MGNDFSVARHKNMTGAHRSAAFSCSSAHFPLRSHIWADREESDCEIVTFFFPDQGKKKVIAVRGKKHLHVCVRAGLDSITQQQCNIRTEVWVEESIKYPIMHFT